MSSPRLEVRVSARAPHRAPADRIGGGHMARQDAGVAVDGESPARTRGGGPVRGVVLLTIREAAERLAVSPRTVRARMRAGRLAYVQERPGAAVRIPERTVEAYLASFTHPATALAPSSITPPPAPRRARQLVAEPTKGRIRRLWE